MNKLAQFLFVSTLFVSAVSWAAPTDTSICNSYIGAGYGLCVSGLHVGCQDQSVDRPVACYKIELKFKDIVGSEVPWLEDKTCYSDSDCRLFSNYCGGCNCNALTVTEPDPSCPDEEIVQCFADPCMDNFQAVCNTATRECEIQR